MTAFEYISDETVLVSRKGKRFWVPKRIRNKSEVFSAFASGLSAPNNYFGENWDAFSDCLLDLDWIKEFHVFVIHQELPHLPHKQLVIYLDILEHAVKVWADEKTDRLQRLYPDFVGHRLTVFFPQEVEQLVLSALKEANS